MISHKNILVRRSNQTSSFHAVSLDELPVPMRENPSVTHVGLWNLGDWLGSLPQWALELNSSQKDFQFFPVHATPPLGLTREPKGVVEWIETCTITKVSVQCREEMMRQTIADEFFVVAEQLRNELEVPGLNKGTKLDVLVGITPAMIAWSHPSGTKGKREAHWNYFSTRSDDGSLVMASTFDLRRYAEESGKPFALFVMSVIVGQVISSLFQISYHDPNRGCLFDFKEDRESFKDSAGCLCGKVDCIASIPKARRTAVNALIETLRKLR